jgi:methylenetetrahydrofolate dehydrogenase (NADP+)/methenyltetrahydrofolate cyclohydrolase
MAKIIDGVKVADELRAELANEVKALAAKGVQPGLSVVLVGDDPASEVYVRMKRKECAELGMLSVDHTLPKTTSEADLLKLLDSLNNDPRVHGILVQLPVPKHINEGKVINAIHPDKDVDCFHPVNVGRMLAGDPGFLPCTPHGCQHLLVKSGHEPAGKHVVVLGRSNIVGKPMAAILMQKAPHADATVTICHSRTRNLEKFTREADILIAAMGVPRFVKADMVREGVVVIDVGTNRVPDATKKSGHRLVGDVDYDAVFPKAEAITPVPGGVGPMTRVMLMKNTVEAAKRAAAAQGR